MMFVLISLACLLSAASAVNVDCKSEHCDCTELHSPDLRATTCDFSNVDEVTLGHIDTVLAIEESGKKLKHFTLTLSHISKLTVTKEFLTSWRQKAESLTWEMADIVLLEQEAVEDESLEFGKTLDIKLSSVNIPTLSAGMFSYVDELNIVANNTTVELITKNSFTKIDGISELRIHQSRIERIEANAMPEPVVLKHKGTKGELNIADLNIGTIENNAIKLQPEADPNDQMIRNFVNTLRISKALSNSIEVKGSGIIILSDLTVENAEPNFLTLEMQEIALTNANVSGASDVLKSVAPSRRLTITNSSFGTKHGQFFEYLDNLQKQGLEEMIIQDNQVICDCGGRNDSKISQNLICKYDDSELSLPEFLEVCKTEEQDHDHDETTKAETVQEGADSTVITAVLITLAMFILAGIVLGVIMYYRKKRSVELANYKKAVTEGEIQETTEPILNKEEHV